MSLPTKSAPGRGEAVDACALADLPDGVIQAIKVGRREVAIARVGDRVHAFSMACPHRAGPLVKGRLACVVDASADREPILKPDALVLMCPWHAWEFSLEDGRAVADPEVRLRTYATDVRAGRVYVAFD